MSLSLCNKSNQLDNLLKFRFEASENSIHSKSFALCNSFINKETDAILHRWFVHRSFLTFEWNVCGVGWQHDECHIIFFSNLSWTTQGLWPWVCQQPTSLSFYLHIICISYDMYVLLVSLCKCVHTHFICISFAYIVHILLCVHFCYVLAAS